jgi:hypothetical protein
MEFELPRMEEGAATSDVVLYKKLANTIFSLSLLMNFYAQAGISLLS